MAKGKKQAASTPVEAYEMHREFSRATLMTGEYSGINPEDLVGKPTPHVRYSLEAAASPDLSGEFAARDPDLDPQYVWRGKRPNDINTLETAAPFIYQLEKIFPRMLIEEMKRQTAIRKNAADAQMTLGEGMEDFDPNAKPSFYNHEEGWKNRMILGDSLQVMASLAENERLRGKVQMIYFDPPYGIKFNSNWQPSTRSTNVKDGAVSDITREPEMVKAFRDTWHDGIHSYLGYLRDRLVVARDLLAETGSVFVQISEENEHRVRAVLEEIFGDDNFVAMVYFRKKLMPLGGTLLENMGDYLLWFAKDRKNVKYRKLFKKVTPNPNGRWTGVLESNGLRRFTKTEKNNLEQTLHCLNVFGTVSQWAPSFSESGVFTFPFRGKDYYPAKGQSWVTTNDKMRRLDYAERLFVEGDNPRYVMLHTDFPYAKLTSPWTDTAPAQGKHYVCQTSNYVIQRCLLMCTDPGDLVLDPTCGSGTTAYVAEQWGRRWITIDTSRVALALARKRLMTAKYPYYLLADSEAGLKKEMEITGKVIQRPTFGKISQGFVYERVPHITLKAIANNSEIDTIWEKYAPESKGLRRSLKLKVYRVQVKFLKSGRSRLRHPPIGVRRRSRSMWRLWS